MRKIDVWFWPKYFWLCWFEKFSTFLSDFSKIHNLYLWLLRTHSQSLIFNKKLLELYYSVAQVLNTLMYPQPLFPLFHPSYFRISNIVMKDERFFSTTNTYIHICACVWVPGDLHLDLKSYHQGFILCM